MKETVPTFRSPSLSKEQDVDDPEKSDSKNGLVLFNQDFVTDIAALTSPKEGIIATMSSDILKKIKFSIIIRNKGNNI